MKSKLKSALLLFLFIFSISPDLMAQFTLGTDIMNRYVWRGSDFGNSPSVQPDINFSSGGFEIGAWAAFATNGNPAGTEVDLYASYTIGSTAGDFQFIITDYTFPEDPLNQYFSSSSHFVELGFGYSGTDSFPVNLFIGSFVTNDEDHSIYSRIGYEFGDVELFLGFTPSKSDLYGTTGAAVLDTGFSVSKEVKVTEFFSMKLIGSMIANPNTENLYFLFGFGF